MSTAGNDIGWRPLRAPASSAGGRPTPSFTRLARVHAASTGADALFATALAGSLFFSIPVGEARGKVFVYLAGAIAPFALLSPLVGPAIDRIAGGRRWMIVGSLAARALCAFLLVRRFEDLPAFLPLAFAILVAQKAYAVSRSALVPTTVRGDDELVRANSKLSLLSGVMGFVAGVPGVIALRLGGPEASLVLASIAYVAAFVLSFQLPQSKVAVDVASTTERVELHAPSILLAAGGMGLLRGIVGFLSILVAFGLRTKSRPLWEFGLVGAGAVGGALLGALIAPKMRDLLREEIMLIMVLGATLVVSGLSAFLLTGVFSAFALATTVGMAGSTGKLAFDSIVQRDAPDANRGRSFARFETRFQILWVVGAAIAVIPMSLEVGFILIFLVSAFATFTYGVGLLAARQRAGEQPTPATAAAIEVEARMQKLSGAARQQAGSTVHSLWDRIAHRRQSHGDD